MGRRLVFAAAAALMMHSAGLAEEKDVIKNYRFEVRPVAFRSTPAINPFKPKVPLKTVETADQKWKVRISTLKLTSVMVGRRRVAIFKEAHGPAYAYILVDGVLQGPDHRPIPGIEGKIEPLGDRGEFHVVLKQGVETIEFDHVIQRLREQSAKTQSGGETASGQTPYG
jgi:hypothetical protein